MRYRKVILPPEQYIEGILKGDRVLLSRAITLVESTRPEHRQTAEQIIAGCLPHSGQSFRVGITGTPGVGKSTFIEAFGTFLTGMGYRIAVLAIDPSSQLSGGSILGDKTRMEQLGADPQAYIRPSPAGDSLGGVARKTRETIILCEAAGHDVILVETVGVGQSEMAVHRMTDFFLLLLLPGAGDELQGIKRGIVEMADLIAVNKADGEREALAHEARQAYKNALHLFPPKESRWTPSAITCSAIHQRGIADIWDNMTEYRRITAENGYLNTRRASQSAHWLHETITAELLSRFRLHPAVSSALPDIEAAVRAGQLSPFAAAEVLLDKFR